MCFLTGERTVFEESVSQSRIVETLVDQFIIVC
jgi:hypothetical protein